MEVGGFVVVYVIDIFMGVGCGVLVVLVSGFDVE